MQGVDRRGLGFSFGMLGLFEIFVHDNGPQVRKEKHEGNLKRPFRSVVGTGFSLQKPDSEARREESVLLNEQDNVADGTRRAGAGRLKPAGRPPTPTGAWPRGTCLLLRWAPRRARLFPPTREDF